MAKRLFYLTTFLLVGIFGFVSNVRAERIGSFDVSAQIGKDGMVNVTEYIKYDFEGAEKHGIFREIPLSSKDGPNIAIEVTGVSDDSGGIPFVASRSGGRLNIKIGDADKLVSGIQNYKIDYQLFGAIRFFEGHDEFYWNVTGNDWQIPILSASAEVSADFEFLNGTSSSCYTGPVGATFQNCSFVIESDMKSIGFSTVGSLAAGNGLTFSVSFPKGLVDPALAKQGFEENDHSISIWWFFAIFIPLVAIFITFFIWVIVISTKKLIGDRRLRGRPVVVQYNAPDGLSIAESAFVGHRSFRAADISPVIIKLAMDGYIKIIYPKDSFFNRNNYELTRTKAGDDIKDGTAKKIFEYLFSDGKDAVKINDLDRREGSELLRDLGVFISSDLLSRGVFEKRNLFSTRLSNGGLDFLWKLFGFAKFLGATEKEKLELMNAPELKPEVFEKFLPYAMVLGVEKKWAKKFENIFIKPPSWVDGYPTNRPFN